jgi:hypothetical protein
MMSVDDRFLASSHSDVTGVVQVTGTGKVLLKQMHCESMVLDCIEYRDLCAFRYVVDLSGCSHGAQDNR